MPDSPLETDYPVTGGISRSRLNIPGLLAEAEGAEHRDGDGHADRERLAGARQH